MFGAVSRHAVLQARSVVKLPIAAGSASRTLRTAAGYGSNSVKNAMMGGSIFAFVGGVYWYTIEKMQQVCKLACFSGLSWA